MYRIMELKNKKDGLYSFQTKLVNKKIEYVEFNNLPDVDSYVEDLLNNKVIDYTVSADIDSNTSTTPGSTPGLSA